MAAVEGVNTGVIATGARYDYSRQVWTGRINGVRVILRCGHTVKTPACYACEHHGELV